MPEYFFDDIRQKVKDKHEQTCRYEISCMHTLDLNNQTLILEKGAIYEKVLYR